MNAGCGRREFIQYAAGLLVAGLPSAAAAGEVRGCCILPANADTAYRTLFNRKPDNPAKADWEQHLSDSSGIGAGFEEALGEVLVDMSRRFGVVPGFGFYNDEAGPNAIAIDKAVVRTTKGMVAFGRTLLQKQLDLDPQGISVAAICAHEFGHIYQYQSGFYERIAQSYPGHLIELHADYLAGAYLNHFEARRPSISLQSVGRAWESMGSSRFTSHSTHGTSAMRLDSIQAGYFRVRDHPDDSLYRIAAAGVDHVRQFASG